MPGGRLALAVNSRRGLWNLRRDAGVTRGDSLRISQRRRSQSMVNSLTMAPNHGPSLNSIRRNDDDSRCLSRLALSLEAQRAVPRRRWRAGADRAPLVAFRGRHHLGRPAVLL